MANIWFKNIKVHISNKEIQDIGVFSCFAGKRQTWTCYEPWNLNRLLPLTDSASCQVPQLLLFFDQSMLLVAKHNTKEREPTESEEKNEPGKRSEAAEVLHVTDGTRCTSPTRKLNRIPTNAQVLSSPMI